MASGHLVGGMRGLALLLCGLAISSPCGAQQIDTRVANDFTLSTLWDGGSGILGVGGTGIDGQVTQMNFGSDGRLYVAVIDGSKGGSSETEGIWRFDYSPTTGLSNPSRVSSLATSALAFHSSGGVEFMYVTDAADIFGSGAVAKAGVLRRMTDSNGDGQWGGPGDINQVLADNVPVVREHRMNQITFSGNTLYTGVGSLTTDGHGETAYNAAVAFIEDVSLLGTEPNAARLGTARTFINSGVRSSDTTPFTSSDPSKLRVHSVGLRNPYGVATDPDGRVYATMNNDQQVPGIGTPADLFFRLERFANYGFSQKYDPDGNVVGLDTRGNGNEIPFVTLPGVGEGAGEAGFSETKNVTSLTTESPGGFVGQYNPANPNGSLGPSAAVGGVDFNTSGDLKLRWHKDAFTARWTYQDVVAIDTDTGEVVRIAHGFNRSLEVLRDPYGNLLVSETPLGDAERARIHLIRATRNRPGEAHLLNLLHQTDSHWSDRSAWGGDFNDDGFLDAPFEINPDDQLVPHQWEHQKYDVEINRPVANLTVTLDQSARVNNLYLNNELALTPGNVLTVDGQLTVGGFGVVKGSSTIVGDVASSGTFSPGPGAGIIVVDGNLSHEGLLQFDLAGPGEFDRLTVAGTATLAGEVQVMLAGGTPGSGEIFDLVTAASIDDAGLFLPVGSPYLLSLANLPGGGQALRLISDSMGVVGDLNGDGMVDAADIAEFLPTWRTAGPKGDLNSDGVVDLGDVAVLHQALSNAELRRAHVPEPATMAALLLLGPTALQRSWRRRPR